MEPLTKTEYQQLDHLRDAPECWIRGKTYIGKVIIVIDGDTLEVAVIIHKTPTKFTLRLEEIQAPEVRSGEVKEFGKKVKEIVEKMLNGKIVKVEGKKREKYRRILAQVYTYAGGEELCLNHFLL
jgi:endonuclease YncB( thermonuclease family)